MSLGNITVRVSEIVRATDEAILIYLEPVGDSDLAYTPGQFLTFIFKRGEHELRRSYSIFTTPGIDDRIGVLVKRVVNGEISRFLIDHLTPGEELQVLPPSGRFTLPVDFKADEKLLFLVAGSGISPAFSIIKEALHRYHANDVSLYFQNRNESGILFQRELEAISQKYAGKFHWKNFLSSPLHVHEQPMRLNNTLLERLLKERNATDSTRFYLCGPPAFMRMCQFVLKFLHVPEERIHREIFYFDSVPANPLHHSKEDRLVQIQWYDRRFNFTVHYPQSILDAALKSGVRLPYSCRGGRCSTCTLRCTSGKVIMSINETLTDRDLSQGLILTCVGYPETDVELQYPLAPFEEDTV